MTRKLNSAFNTLKFGLSSPANFKTLGKKIIHRFLPQSDADKNELLKWFKNNCSDYAAIANNIAPELWKESLQFSDKLTERSNEILETIQFKLGGGGIYPFLYFLTRLIKPVCIVETGVAAGFTSQTFLSAIKKNNAGFLYSSDFPYFRIKEPEKYIGILVEDDLKKHWELHIKGDEINLPAIINKVKEIDVFHYDSDKTYKGRVFATELAEQKLSKNGFIIYDDIQDNAFFYDYVKQHPGKQWYIFEFGGKYIGVIGDLNKRKL